MPLTTVEVPFGEFLPDQPDYRNPGLTLARNVFPSPGGYGPFLGASAQGDTIDEAVKGAALFFRSDGTSVIVGGTDTKLFVLVGGTLTSTTGYTSIGANDIWRFAFFNGRVFAVAPNNNPQELPNIETSTTWSAAGGSPPQAKVVAHVGYFLMLGNLSGLGLPYTLQWSAENDPTDFPTPGTTDARLKASGRVALQTEYGPIMAITGDRYPIVFQERCVSRLDPIGPPQVFNAQTFEEARGCIAPASVVTVGFRTFFLSHDGFYVTDGNETLPIGSQRVNEFFFADVSETDRFRTHGAISWENQSVVWSYYPVNDPTGFKKQIIFSWQEGRWSTAELTVDWMVDNKIGATTIDDITASIDSTTESIDSSIYFAKSRVLSAFIQDGAGNSEMNLLNGDALEALFETGDFEPVPGKRVAINAVYTLVENADEDTAARLITRTRKGGAETTGPETNVNAFGFAPVRGEGRWAKVRVRVPAASMWDKGNGIQLELRASGYR